MCDTNSTRTRVTPVFNALINQDPTGAAWLNPLLALPRRETADWVRPDFTDLGSLESSLWGSAEKKLFAPRSLLRWLLRNASAQNDDCWNRSERTNARRRALINRTDPKVLADALRELEQPILPEQKWYIFEGASKPDVYLQTPELIVVVEGKRTEPTPTTGTDWMAGRHQMLRHIDGALDIAGSRRVVGFFIVEGVKAGNEVVVPQVWLEAARDTVSLNVLATSLPHRSSAQHKQIADGFLGVATWQRVCAQFNIPFPPDVQPE